MEFCKPLREYLDIFLDAGREGPDDVLEELTNETAVLTNTNHQQEVLPKPCPRPVLGRTSVLAEAYSSNDDTSTLMRSSTLAVNSSWSPSGHVQDSSVIDRRLPQTPTTEYSVWPYQLITGASGISMSNISSSPSSYTDHSDAGMWTEDEETLLPKMSPNSWKSDFDPNLAPVPKKWSTDFDPSQNSTRDCSGFSGQLNYFNQAYPVAPLTSPYSPVLVGSPSMGLESLGNAMIPKHIYSGHARPVFLYRQQMFVPPTAWNNNQSHFRNPRILNNRKICVFCKKNKETEEFYSTHVLKDCNGKVICPILRNYHCPNCGATGDNAHTIKHCPYDIKLGEDRL